MDFSNASDKDIWKELSEAVKADGIPRQIIDDLKCLSCTKHSIELCGLCPVAERRKKREEANSADH